MRSLYSILISLTWTCTAWQTLPNLIAERFKKWERGRKMIFASSETTKTVWINYLNGIPNYGHAHDTQTFRYQMNNCVSNKENLTLSSGWFSDWKKIAVIFCALCSFKPHLLSAYWSFSPILGLKLEYFLRRKLMREKAIWAVKQTSHFFRQYMSRKLNGT